MPTRNSRATRPAAPARRPGARPTPPVHQDRFRIYQPVFLHLKDDPYWKTCDGTAATILTPSREGGWEVTNPETGKTEVVQERRYLVATVRGAFNFSEEMLRPLKVDRRHSSWEAFERATGIRPDFAHPNGGEA